MSNEVIPPPYVITGTDKRGLIVVITATTLSFVLTCFLIQIWLRMKMREWRADDFCLAAATFLGTVQSAVVLHIAKEGLGWTIRSLSDDDLRSIGKHDFASQILYIFTLLLSKSAVLSLYLRLSPRRDHHLASWTTLGISVVWAVMSIILIAVPMSPLTFWIEGPSKGPSIFTKWQVIGAIDIVTELFIFFTSIYLVAKLNMRIKSKILVVAAFSARVPVIVAAAIRLSYLRSTLYSNDRTLEGAYYVVCTQWQLGYAIMSSTITGLGPFLRPFGNSFVASYRRSSFSGPSLPNASGGRSADRSGSHGDVTGNYPLSPLKADHGFTSNKKGRQTPDSASNIATRTSSQVAILPQSLKLRPDARGLHTDTAISGGENMTDEDESVGRMSNESRRMIITKRTEVTVETNRANSFNVGVPGKR